MEKNFWKDKWDNNEIRFHLSEVNPIVLKFGDEILKNNVNNVLIPLCGKSLDILWFAKKADKVIGVELLDRAVKDFFKENSLEYTVEEKGIFKIYKSANIEIYQGDFFQFPIKDFNITSVFDRGCTVAFPLEMRKDYYQKIIKELNSKTSWLLSSFEYDQAIMSGPPFSVRHDELNQFLSDTFKIDKIYEEDVNEFELSKQFRKVYLLEKE